MASPGAVPALLIADTLIQALAITPCLIGPAIGLAI
jgi:hypothetical protein